MPWYRYTPYIQLIYIICNSYTTTDIYKLHTNIVHERKRKTLFEDNGRPQLMEKSLPVTMKMMTMMTMVTMMLLLLLVMMMMMMMTTMMMMMMKVVMTVEELTASCGCCSNASQYRYLVCALENPLLFFTEIMQKKVWWFLENLRNHYCFCKNHAKTHKK